MFAFAATRANVDTMIRVLTKECLWDCSVLSAFLVAVYSGVFSFLCIFADLSRDLRSYYMKRFRVYFKMQS